MPTSPKTTPFHSPSLMKITLNTSIPTDRRPQIEAIVKDQIHHCEIVWLPSRFPRFVMLVEPGPGQETSSHETSIFDSDPPEDDSLSAMTDLLESRIKSTLAAPKR